MVVFWWQGKGYQTILIWLVTVCFFGIGAAAGRSLGLDRPWYWGLSFVVTAAANWYRGTQLNARSLEKRKPQTVWQRLFYKARHRFMSMPMETFSLVLAAAGIVFGVHGELAS